jgi:two-component system, sensor histidine kinase and response regulator
MTNEHTNDTTDDTTNDTPHTTLDQASAPWRAPAASPSKPQASFVISERGRRREPCVEADDRVRRSGEPLHRRDGVKAGALAAGDLSAAAPVQAAWVDRQPCSPLSLLDDRAQGRLILVAEDNEVNQAVICRQLALLGFAAQVTSTGREALDHWRRGEYALLLTDLNMPQMDGFELTVAIRAAEAGRHRMPIVALTANALGGEASRCRDLGMDDCMAKPVQLARLRSMLQQWLPEAAPLAPAPGAPDAPAPTKPVSRLEFDASARGVSPAQASVMEPA